MNFKLVIAMVRSVKQGPLIVNGNWYNYPYLYDIFSRAEDYTENCINIIEKFVLDKNFKIINPIDLGSGTGKLYDQLLKKITVEGNIYLVDKNKNMVNYLKRNISSSNVKIIEAEIEKVQVAKSNFIIVSFAFPSNLLDKNKILNELKNIYKHLLNDGVLITIGWNEKWDDEFFELWKKYLNVDYSKDILMTRNCNLTWLKDDINSKVKFSNIADRNKVLGSFFGYKFISDYKNSDKLEWNIRMGITLNTKKEIKKIIDDWEMIL